MTTRRLISVKQRHSLVAAVASLAIVVMGCGKLNPTEVRSEFLKPGVIVDDSPAWSSDGMKIAFHRGFASSLGPPGVYVVASAGGTPRLVMAGDFSGPRWLAFSPDGLTLASIWQDQLTIIDLATGTSNVPTYTDNVAASPAWSPDGKQVAYSRLFLNSFPPEPTDSAGIHIYDFESQTDRTLYLDGSAVAASDVVWPARIGELVYLFQGPTGSSVASVRPDGSEGRVIATVEGASYEYLQWYESATNPLRGPLVLRTQTSRSTILLDPLSGRESQWVMQLGPWDAISPDGSHVVLVRPEESSGFSVLFVSQALDYSGATRRALTTWHPPGG